MDRTIVALDIGGTKIALAVVHLANNPEAKPTIASLKKIPTAAHRGGHRHHRNSEAC